MAQRNRLVFSREDSLSDWKLEDSDPDWIVKCPRCPLSKPRSKAGRPFNIEFRQRVLEHLATCIETDPKFRLTVASAKRAGKAVQDHPHFSNNPGVRALQLTFRWGKNILKILQDHVASLASGKRPGDDVPNEMIFKVSVRRYIPIYFVPKPCNNDRPPPLI